MTDFVAKGLPLLTESNYKSWLVNIRAVLRQNGHWDTIQEPLGESTPTKDAKVYQKAADMLTPTISQPIQEMLVEADFNNANLLLAKLKSRFEPMNEQVFMNTYQELLSTVPEGFDSHENWMTRIKVLNERIDATNIEFTADKRTLLVMMQGLQSNTTFRSLVQIWASTPNMTGVQAMASLREELAREDLDKIRESMHLRASVAMYANNPRRKKEKEKEVCEHCQKPGHTIDKCWKKHPHLRPDWAGGVEAGTGAGGITSLHM